MQPPVREATPDDAALVAGMLHAFNTEFGTPTPEVVVLADRLRRLLAGPATRALLVGDPAVGVALSTRRPNVWYDGPVELLDELWVRPDRRDRGLGTALVRRLLDDARAAGVGAVEINVDEGDLDTLRFYERHGFRRTEPGSDERAFYVWQELDGG